jgi:ABC-type multidrug transport system permease subunit
VLAACLLAALGGCWWPIEITPAWMQTVQKMIPTGWTMDALHKLVSFQAEPLTVVPNVLTLIVAAAVLGVLAARRFEYQ